MVPYLVEKERAAQRGVELAVGGRDRRP